MLLWKMLQQPRHTSKLFGEAVEAREMGFDFHKKIKIIIKKAVIIDNIDVLPFNNDTK